MRWGVDIVSKPRIWNRGASAISLETQPTFQTAGDGKDGNPAYLNPTTYWRHLDALFPGLVGVYDVEVLRY